MVEGVLAVKNGDRGESDEAEVVAEAVGQQDLRPAERVIRPDRERRDKGSKDGFPINHLPIVVC